MELKEGYKMTEVGVIPEDWEVKKLGNIGKFSKGSGVKKDEASSGDIPCVRYGELYTKHHDYIKQFHSFVSKDIAETAKRLKTGDILFAGSGETKEEIGKCVSFIDEIEAYAGGDIVIFSPLNAASLYLGYLLNAPIIQKQKASRGQGDAVVHISATQLGDISIPVPPTLSEQTAIATALSDMDALITRLEQLIAKKRSIKQGVMQELLTGKRRLPGFGGEWISTEFGQVMEGFSSGQTPYRAIKDYYKGSIPWITSGELNYNVVRDTNEKITEGAVQKTNLKILPVGTFLMAITGLEAAGTRGSCAITGVESTTNQSCMALFPKADKLTTSYLFHYYVFAGNELALKYCQGTKQQSYTGSLAKKLPISLPSSIEEQQAISSVLDDLDTEVTALTQKLTKLQLLKQGMMQNLLTGKIRLI